MDCRQAAETIPGKRGRHGFTLIEVLIAMAIFSIGILAVGAMQKAVSIISNQQGSIITMALIFLVLLTVIGIATTNTSITERKLTTNTLLHNVAFYTADAGIEAGRAALTNLKAADRGSWDVLLSNLTADPDEKVSLSCDQSSCYNLNEVIDVGGGRGRTVGPTIFSLTIEDNDDRDNNNSVDTDNTVLLTSTASYRGSVITIEAIVRAGGGGGDLCPGTLRRRQYRHGFGRNCGSRIRRALAGAVTIASFGRRHRFRCDIRTGNSCNKGMD